MIRRSRRVFVFARNRVQTVVHGTAAALSLMLATASHAATLSADDLALLKTGDAVVHVAEDSTGEADAVIEAAIDLPYDASRVFAVMLDCRRSVRYVTGLKSCRVVKASTDGLSEIREHRSQWLGLFPETVIVFRADYKINREIRFERVSGDLRYLKGIWRMTPLKNGTATRLTYAARIGVTAAVPAFMVRNALEADIAKVLKGLRTEVARSLN